MVMRLQDYRLSSLPSEEELELAEGKHNGKTSGGGGSSSGSLGSSLESSSESLSGSISGGTSESTSTSPLQPWNSPFKPLIEKLLAKELSSLATSSEYLKEHSNALEVQEGRAEEHLVLSSWGEVDWQNSFEEMVAFTKNRSEDTLDQILLLEHAPVYTQGIAGKAEHVLNDMLHIPVVQADRGGQVTYHGPRQLIVYLLFDFNRKKKFYSLFEVEYYARNIVHAMENALVSFAQLFGVKAYAKADAPGIYIDGKKVSSLGLKVSRQGTYHGIAINLDMDLFPFSMINPCGYAGLEMINLLDYLDVERLTELMDGSAPEYREAGFSIEKEDKERLSSKEDGLKAEKQVQQQAIQLAAKEALASLLAELEKAEAERLASGLALDPASEKFQSVKDSFGQMLNSPYLKAHQAKSSTFDFYQLVKVFLEQYFVLYIAHSFAYRKLWVSKK